MRTSAADCGKRTAEINMGDEIKLLQGIKVVTLAVNVPGPVAASRLYQLGAEVIKVEPPTGDPLSRMSQSWYQALAVGQKVISLDLKDDHDRAEFETLLRESDLLLTSIRPAALGRLGLDQTEVSERNPRLCQVAIVGYAAPNDSVAGHDLTYQADAGLISPPRLPRTLLADLATAERAVSTALALLLARELLARERGGGGFAQVALSEAMEVFSQPLRHRATTTGEVLGGGLPEYNLYQTREGWVALAALEPHFWKRFKSELALGEKAVDVTSLASIFMTKTAVEWEMWAAELDLPLVAVRDIYP
jgi:crotonobetainyl-CoA:carnitine CoA-transferase CaiB-like acyl-CoA transferase